jgi:hypothetical protein
MRVTNGIPLGCPLPLTVTAVNYVATLKGYADELCPVLPPLCTAPPDYTLEYITFEPLTSVPLYVVGAGLIRTAARGEPAPAPAPASPSAASAAVVVSEGSGGEQKTIDLALQRGSVGYARRKIEVMLGVGGGSGGGASSSYTGQFYIVCGGGTVLFFFFGMSRMGLLEDAVSFLHQLGLNPACRMHV